MVGKAAEDFPKATFIGAHLGGMYRFGEVERFIAGKRNVYNSTAWDMYWVIAWDITRSKDERDHCGDVIGEWKHFKISLCVIASYLKLEEELQYKYIYEIWILERILLMYTGKHDSEEWFLTSMRHK